MIVTGQRYPEGKFFKEYPNRSAQLVFRISANNRFQGIPNVRSGALAPKSRRAPSATFDKGRRRGTPRDDQKRAADAEEEYNAGAGAPPRNKWLKVN